MGYIVAILVTAWATWKISKFVHTFSRKELIRLINDVMEGRETVLLRKKVTEKKVEVEVDD
jgi:hypothetical protein